MPRYLVGTLLFAALAASGCASRRCCPPAESLPVAQLQCQQVQRQAISPDVSAVPPRGSVTFEDRQYCNLPERDAQCLAAGNSPLAKLLEQEAAALAAQPPSLHHDDTGCAQRILCLQATHERNRSAAAALQLYLRLAEAEAGAANVKLRLEQVAGLLADVRRMQAAGVASTLSQSTVQAQQLELLHKQVDLEATIEELNHQLVSLLGAEPPPEARLWPDADLKVDPTVPNVAEEQQLAQQRCDVAALRLASCCDLEVMRTLLGQANAGLGLSLNSCQALAALHVAARQSEASLRSRQLSAAADEQQRTIMYDVARTIATMEARVLQIGLSRRRLEALQRQAERTEQSHEFDATAPFEVRQSRLDVLAAEQELLHDVIEWKLAVVKLRELQGELGVGCGYVCN